MLNLFEPFNSSTFDHVGHKEGKNQIHEDLQEIGQDKIQLQENHVHGSVVGENQPQYGGDQDDYNRTHHRIDQDHQELGGDEFTTRKSVNHILTHGSKAVFIADENDHNDG